MTRASQVATMLSGGSLGSIFLFGNTDAFLRRGALEMTTRLRSIVWKQGRDYEVTFDIGGAQRQCICTVEEDGRIQFVNARPEILTTTGISPRWVANAVCAFDRCRLSDE